VGYFSQKMSNSDTGYAPLWWSELIV
jgi:hypothetical protein